MHFPTGAPSIASGIPPLTKAAVKDVNSTSTNPGESTSIAMVAKPPLFIATTSAGQESSHSTRAASSSGNSNGNGSMIGGGATGSASNVTAAGPSGRDPRGKARSRDYLKQLVSLRKKKKVF